jgi:hypothetical protein
VSVKEQTYIIDKNNFAKLFYGSCFLVLHAKTHHQYKVIELFPIIFYNVTLYVYALALSIPKNTIISSMKMSFKSLSKGTLLYLSETQIELKTVSSVKMADNVVQVICVFLICYLPALSLADGDML